LAVHKSSHVPMSPRPCQPWLAYVVVNFMCQLD
jgi:hypothetical protein